MNYKILLLLSFLFIGSSLSAQSFDEYRKRMMRNFDEYKERKQNEFEEYRNKVNASIAEYIAKPWERHTVMPAFSAPTFPEPPVPDEYDPDQGTSNELIPSGTIIDNSAPRLRPEPFAPINVPERERQSSFVFDYYGTECGVPLKKSHIFKLRGIDEDSVHEAWNLLSSSAYLPVIYESLCWRDEMNLCDWGYVLFLEKMTSAFFPKDMRNEAKLMQVFILSQSGYMVRLGRFENSLALLLPSDKIMTGYTYLPIQGHKYYVLDKTAANKEMYLTDFIVPKEQMLSLGTYGEQVMAEKLSPPRTYASKKYPELSFTLSVNENLIEFYNDYPLSSDWDMYSEASLSSCVKRQWYPALRSRLDGKDPRAAAEMLLNFVQTAFQYGFDVEQLGEERAFFADETLFYPYSDCEDRAILYSILVRDLLGLDVVLLYYPNEHLATAVRFGDDVSGDHVDVDGVKYTICDPTYIGASIGSAMPRYKGTTVNIIKIRKNIE